jgi:hypothetical protein
MAPPAPVHREKAPECGDAKTWRKHTPGNGTGRNDAMLKVTVAR